MVPLFLSMMPMPAGVDIFTVFAFLSYVVKGSSRKSRVRLSPPRYNPSCNEAPRPERNNEARTVLSCALRRQQISSYFHHLPLLSDESLFDNLHITRVR